MFESSKSMGNNMLDHTKDIIEFSVLEQTRVRRLFNLSLRFFIKTVPNFPWLIVHVGSVRCSYCVIAICVAFGGIFLQATVYPGLCKACRDISDGVFPTYRQVLGS